MNRRSFFKHAVCILFLVFAMGQVWGTDYISVGDGNWNRPLQYVDNNRTWTYNIWANGQYPKDDTNDNVTITHNVTVPAGCTDAKANTINVSGKGSLSCVGNGELTANTVNVNEGGSLVYTSGMTVNSINVESGGKIVLNAWPTPAPTFNDGCIVEIGPSFPTDATTLLALKRAMDGKLLSVTITTSQTLANIGSAYEYDTITIKAGGSLTVPNGVAVTAKRLVIEKDNASSGSLSVAGIMTFSNDSSNGSVNSGSINISTTGSFNFENTPRNAYLLNLGTITNSGILNVNQLENGDGTNKAEITAKGTTFSAGLLTNKKNSEVTYESGTTLNGAGIDNAGKITIKTGCSVNIGSLGAAPYNGAVKNSGDLIMESGSTLTYASFENTGYLVRNVGCTFGNFKIPDGTNNTVATIYVENKGSSEKTYTLPTGFGGDFCVAGNINVVTAGQSLNTFKVYQKTDDNTNNDHTMKENFTVKLTGTGLNVDGKTGVGDNPDVGLDLSRTSRTASKYGTLSVECPLSVKNEIFLHTGTVLNIKETITAGLIKRYGTDYKIEVNVAQGKTLSTDNLYLNNSEVTLKNEGTVEITNGGAFEVYKCTTAGDITFKAGGSLTANSLTGNKLTVNTTAVNKIFTLNSDVTFADVILEGSSGQKLSVFATGDFKLAENGGVNSYASNVDFQNAYHPAIHENDGTTEADVLAVDSTGAGAGGALPAGWLKGSANFYIWNGSKDSVWTNDDNWLRKNNPNEKLGIEEIRINTKAGGNSPNINKDVTADKLNILAGKTASVTAAITLTLKNLSGPGTLNLGKGTLKNGNAGSKALDITETILSFGDGTSASTLVGEIKINKLTSSTGSVNIGTDSDQAEVTFVPGVSVSDITVATGSKVTFTADSSCGKMTNKGTVTSSEKPVLSISGDFKDTGTWENVQPKFTDTLNVYPMAGTGYPILWVEAPGKTVTLKGNFSFATDQGVYVNGGTLSVDSGVTIVNAKNVFIEKGTLTGAGTLSLTDQLSNKDTVSISKIEFTGTTAGQINSNENGKSYKSVELKNSVTDFKVVKQTTFEDFTDNSLIASPNVLTFSDTATITNSITGSEVKGNIKTNGTNVDVKLSKIDGTFTCSGAKTTVNKALEVTGNVTVDSGKALVADFALTCDDALDNKGTLTANAPISVGTTLTNSGTIKSKSTITVTGNCTNNNTGTISDIDASNTGVLNLGSDFTDSGTTSISEIVFFGDKNHTFKNKAATQYKTVTLDSTIAGARTVTVANNANITTFTDNTANANVTFNGTATLGSITTDSHTAGKYTFSGNARVMSDTTFKPEVEFKANATFQDNAATPANTDATFNNKVSFSNANGTITGKDLTFEKAVSFPTANGNNTITGNDVNFKDNVSAKDLSVIAANLTLNTTPAAPAITFTATNLTLTGAGTTLKHGTTGNKIIITGSLVSDTTLAVSDPLEVSGAITVNAGKSISANGTLKTGTTLENNGTFIGSDTITVGTSLTNAGTFTGNGTLSVGTYLTNSGTFTGSSTITVGTTLTNSGTISSKSTITVTGNCTNNPGGIISDVDASNKGELHLKANFTDSGTTSISKVKFLGATHDFVPGTSEYIEIELAKEVGSLTVKTNDISFTTFTDTQDSSAGRTVTFEKDVYSKADNTFYAKVMFDGNAIFQDSAAAPNNTDATFNGTVTFSKADGAITGKNLTFNDSVTFPVTGTNSITAEELTFNKSVTSGNLNIAADKLMAKEITAKIPGTPGNPDVIKTVTLQTKIIELSSSAATPETVKINGKLDSSVSLTLKDDVYVSSDVKLTGSGKALSVDTGKKLLCGHDFRANGISISGDVAIKSNANWEECFAEAVNCDISNSSVYFWNGNLTNSGFSGDGTRARIPCENCTDSGSNTNWQFTDIAFISAKTISDCEIELTVSDKASDFMTGSTLTAFVNASGTNHTGTITNSSAITYTVTRAKADPADANQTILTLKTNGGTWNTDSTGTSTGNTYSTDRNGLQQTELPVIKIERGTGGDSESYTITNKWGKRFASYDGTTNPVFDQTSDGASPVLIHVYTGQENHVAASTGNQQNYDAHNFLEFVYSEPVSLYKNADKPTGLASGTPYMASGVVDNLQSVAGDLGAAVNNGSGVIITGIANFSQGKLVTKKHVSGALDTADTTLNVFYRKAADDNSTSFRWGLASFANATPLVAGTDSFVDFAGYIDEVQLFGGTISAPSSADALIFDAEKNPGNMVRPGLAIETARTSGGVGVAGTADNTIGTWDIKGPDFVPVRKQGDVWSDVPSTVKNYEIAGTARGAATTLSGVEFHFFDNQPEYSAADEAEWFIRTGWTDSSGNLKLTESYAADIFGGSRMFADSSSRTGGGIRYSSLRKAVDEGVFTYRTVNSHGNTSVNYSSFGNVITPGEKALIFSSLDRGNTRNVQTFDSPYFGLEMPGSTNELRTTFEITYTESKGVLTDLAGNKLVCPEGKRVVHSVDMTPPDFSLTVAAIGSKKLFVLFSKKIQVDKIIFRDASDNIVPFSSTALEDIPKSLGFATIANKQRPVPVTSIQIDESVPAKVICSTDNNTGLELTLTKEATFENMENLFLVVKNVPGLANLRDPITGIVTQLSFVQDELGNYMSENQAHIFSDFAVNLVSPVYAYSTGEQVDGETVFENFYGDGNYSVHDFTREQQNFGTMITGGDMIIVSNTDKAITSAKQIKLWASVNPSDGSVSNELNATASLDLRVWLPTVVLPLAKNYNKNVFGVLSENLNSSGIRDGIKTTIPQTSGFGDGDTVSFLFEVMNKDGTTRKFCHSPKLNIDGTLSLDESDETVVGPLYVLNQLDPNDILSLDLWSFKLKTPVSQRGGVSILNNVINSGLGEKTMVKVDVPAAVSDITVMVLTLDGNVIKYLHTGPEKAGTHYYDWDGSNLAGKAVARGMYFIRVVGNGFDETRKVMVVK